MDIPGRIVQRKVETHLLGVRGYHCGCLLPGSPSKGSSDSIPRLSCASSFPAWCRCSSCIQMDVCSQPPEGQVVERGLLEMLLLLLPSHFSCVQLCATPLTAAHEAHLSLGFSRQEHWSGLPFPSPMHKSESEVVQSCPTVATPWTAAYQAPPSMGFSRQKYWSGVPLPSPLVNSSHSQFLIKVSIP